MARWEMIASRLNTGIAIGSIVLGIAATLSVGSAEVADPTASKIIDGGNGGGQPAVRSPDLRGPKDRVFGANPLWAIPLKELSATRERPIFSPSRRPPPPAAAAAPYIPPPPKPVEPERPQLALVGTIAGEDEAFAIFLDQTTNTVVRLKLGDHHRGWMLRQVLGREAVLQKDSLTSVLALPSPGNAKAAAAPAGTQVADDPVGRRTSR
jgi:hypothetical protein